jgi:hypothetical protein
LSSGAAGCGEEWNYRVGQELANFIPDDHPKCRATALELFIAEKKTWTPRTSNGFIHNYLECKHGRGFHSIAIDNDTLEELFDDSHKLVFGEAKRLLGDVRKEFGRLARIDIFVTGGSALSKHLQARLAELEDANMKFTYLFNVMQDDDLSVRPPPPRYPQYLVTQFD